MIRPDLDYRISGNTDGALVLRAMRCGIKEFLVKPLKPEELAEAIERAMMGRTAVKEPGKLIAVIGTAGGVGASVLALLFVLQTFLISTLDSCGSKVWKAHALRTTDVHVLR